MKTGTKLLLVGAATALAVGLSSIPVKPIIRHCQSINGLPDRKCTYGAIRTTNRSEICHIGATKQVRPPTSYTNKLKLKQMQEYGFTGSPQDFEEDHLIPLELGGHPTDPANLWPQPRDGAHSAADKDKVENYLHREVCAGRMEIKTAQRGMSENWEQYESP